jgi:hypothetical protein
MAQGPYFILVTTSRRCWLNKNKRGSAYQANRKLWGMYIAWAKVRTIDAHISESLTSDHLWLAGGLAHLPGQTESQVMDGLFLFLYTNYRQSSTLLKVWMPSSLKETELLKGFKSKRSP